MKMSAMTLNPANSEDALYELEARRRIMSDWFDFWRRGIAHDWEEEAREPHWRAIPMPRPGVWPGPAKLVSDSNTHPRHFEAEITCIDVAEDSSGPGAKLKISKVHGRLAPSGLVFQKILGKGGMGIAALFKATIGGKSRDLVIKLDLHDWDEFGTGLSIEKLAHNASLPEPRLVASGPAPLT